MLKGNLAHWAVLFWENYFYDYWEIDSLQFIDSTRQIIFYDDEGGRFEGYIDKDNEYIQGFAIWDEEDESDPFQLDFVRAAENELYKYFIPYPQSPDGSTNTLIINLKIAMISGKLLLFLIMLPTAWPFIPLWKTSLIRNTDVWKTCSS